MRHLPNLSLLSLQGPSVPTGGKQKRAAAPKKGALADAPGSSEGDDESEDLFGPQTEDESSGSESPPKKALSQVKKAKPNRTPGASAQKKQGASLSAPTNPAKKAKPPYQPGPSSSKKKAAPPTDDSSDSDTPLADRQPKGKKQGKGKQPQPKKPKPLHVPGASADNKRKDAEAADLEAARKTKAKNDVEDASYAKGMAEAAAEARKPNHNTDEVEAGRREYCCGHR